MAFNPELGNWYPVGKFRFWCQKVLPLVYDDSLSYYELLCKVVDYLNKYGEDLGMLLDEFEALVAYVNNYIENEIEPKLIEIVDDWITEHPEYVTTVMDGAITRPKINNSLWQEIENIPVTGGKLTESAYEAIEEELFESGITFEYGVTDNDVYTVFTVPKNKFRMSLEPIRTNPNQSGTIKEYVLKNKPYLVMNISNVGNFLYNGALYGESYTQGQHGSIYALKEDSVDFDIFEQGTVLNQLLSQGYVSAMAGWNCLRENGVNKPVDWEYPTYAEPNPRQTLAWDDDNWYIYTSYSRFQINGDHNLRPFYGKTMNEILLFCTTRGWPNVCALDGGGSNYVAGGQPFREFSINIDNGYQRDCHLCIAFNLKEEE